MYISQDIVYNLYTCNDTNIDVYVGTIFTFLKGISQSVQTILIEKLKLTDEQLIGRKFIKSCFMQLFTSVYISARAPVLGYQKPENSVTLAFLKQHGLF